MPSEATTTTEAHETASHKQPVSSDAAGESFGGVLGNVLSNSMAEPRNNKNSRLSDPLLSHPVNSSFRSTAFKHAQQSHGNHFVQRLIASTSASAPVIPLIQRQCSCETGCETCRSGTTVPNEDANDSTARSSYFAAGGYAQASRIPGAPAGGIEVGDEHDPMEHEAGRVAESATQSGSKQSIGRKVLSTSGATSPPIASADSGSALPSEVRERVEPLVGADLSHVRVHDDVQANQTAASLNARAFTVQNHIWLGPSQSASNVQLMAHEATHVVQQSGTARPAIQRWVDPTTATLTPDEVSTWSERELMLGLTMLLDQTTPVNQSVPEVDPEATDTNLKLIISAAVSNHIDIPDDLLEAFARKIRSACGSIV